MAFLGQPQAVFWLTRLALISAIEVGVFAMYQTTSRAGVRCPSEEVIDARLRRARENVGLSQRALAKRAGITNSTISLMESNGTNPSIGALKSVLDAISVSLSDFFAMDEPTSSQTFFLQGRTHRNRQRPGVFTSGWAQHGELPVADPVGHLSGRCGYRQISLTHEGKGRHGRHFWGT